MREPEDSIVSIETVGVSVAILLVGIFGLWLYSKKSMNTPELPSRSQNKETVASRLPSSASSSSANTPKQTHPHPTPQAKINNPNHNTQPYPELSSYPTTVRDAVLALPTATLLQLQKKQRLVWLARNIESMKPQELASFKKEPWNLPFFLLSNTDTTLRVLERYGYRAWRLLSLIDYRSKPIEQMSKALDRFGEIVLEVGEEYGLAFALFFIPKTSDEKACLPSLLHQMIKSFRKAEKSSKVGTSQAFALWMQAHDDLFRLLTDKNIPCRSFKEPIEMLASTESVIRRAAADSPFTIRFLLERDERQHIGFELLKRYGSLAPSTLYGLDYHLDEDEKRGAIVVIKHRGWDGLYLLNRFHALPSWRTLLKRKELYQDQTAPLLAKVIHQIFSSKEPEKMIALFSQIGRLEIIDRQIPPDLADKALGWVPGYTLAANIYRSKARGHQISTLSYLESTVDVIPHIGKIGQVGKFLAKGGKALLKTVQYTKKTKDYLKRLHGLVPQSFLSLLATSKEKGTNIFQMIQHKALLRLKKQKQTSFVASLSLVLRQHLLQQSKTRALKISPTPEGLFRRISSLHQQLPDIIADRVLKAATGFARIGIQPASLPKALAGLPWRELLSKKLKKAVQEQMFSLLLEKAFSPHNTPSDTQKPSPQ